MKTYMGLKMSGSKIIGRKGIKYKGVCHCGKFFYRTSAQLKIAKKRNILECFTCRNVKIKFKKDLNTKPSIHTKHIKGKDAQGFISLYVLWENMSHKDITFDLFYNRYVHCGWSLKKALLSPLGIKDEDHGDIGRRQITAKVTSAAIGYLVKKGYGVYRELSVKAWGARRVDVCGINLYGHMIICEVKSGMADFRADKKMHEYLPYCNKMYVAFPHTMKITTDIKKEITSMGIGIMVLETNGLIRVRSRAKYRLITDKQKDELLHRMVWRSAVSSKRTTVRTREFL